jgi:hypothetical protein
LNIDKLFRTDSNDSQEHFKGGFPKFENFKSKKPQCSVPHEDSIFMLSPDFVHEGSDDEERGINKLFEDPEEKMEKIKKSIDKSQIKKRQRLNSGNSNQSGDRGSKQYKQKYLPNDTANMNNDLVKSFTEEIHS